MRSETLRLAFMDWSHSPASKAKERVGCLEAFDRTAAIRLYSYILVTNPGTIKTYSREEEAFLTAARSIVCGLGTGYYQ